MIWRRLEIPTDLTLEELHVVLQKSFNWLNSVMFQFEVDGEVYGPTVDEFEDGALDEDSMLKTTKVGDVFRVGQRSVYCYDATNGWKVDVEVERAVTGRDRKAFAFCAGGEEPGPYEAVDPDQYQHELRAEKRRASREAKPIDTDVFDIAWLNSQIATFDATVPVWGRGNRIPSWPAFP